LEDLAGDEANSNAKAGSALAEHFSNLSSSNNANASTKRGRDDISATPQKKAPTTTPQKANGQGQEQEGEEQDGEEVRTPSPLDQGVTPYWKALEERGRNNTSPKLTRSAAKKKLQSKQQAGNGGMGGDGGGVGFHQEAYRNGAGGGDVLMFSPPDQVKNAERERKEIRAKEDNR